MKKKSKIVICEVGLRDGLQNEKKMLSVAEKVNLVDSIVNSGIKVIEIGSFMSPKAVPQMANTDEVFEKLSFKNNVEYRSLIGNVKGVERAIECGCKKVKINVSACKFHNLENLNRTPEESIAKFEEICSLAQKNNLEVSGSISMPFGSPWQYKIPVEDITKIIDAYVNLGIYEISLSDASGMAMPYQVYELCTQMQAKYPKVKWILHFHNTRGMGMANILAAMESGITWFDASFGGLGGCPFVPGAAGNVVTEDIVNMCEESGIETGINLDLCIENAKKVSFLLNKELPGFVLKAGKNKSLLR